MEADTNIESKSYGDVFVKKFRYFPVRVHENLFDRVLGRGNYEVEIKINELIEQDPWLKSNVPGEENLFSLSQNDYFPVYVETSKHCINRYCTAGQIVKLRSALMHSIL